MGFWVRVFPRKVTRSCDIGCSCVSRKRLPNLLRTSEASSGYKNEANDSAKDLKGNAKLF